LFTELMWWHKNARRLSNRPLIGCTYTQEG
jgi:hypothetical protein